MAVHRRRLVHATLLTGALVVIVAACGSSATTSGTSASAGAVTSSTSGSPATGNTSTESGLKKATWSSGVTLTYSDGYVEYRSNGIPDHDRQSQYALPNTGARVPAAATAHAEADPTAAQSYDFKIPTNPTKAATTTSASLGSIGVMISGAALFNPYEGDGTTVATASNFTVKNSAGQDVAFLDSCNGHPTPMGQYHYHALPTCVTAMVDTASGPSHLIGIAFDGFPIYGDRDIDGNQVTASQLDECNGITSATPEFPDGIYHYVLLATADSTSSIKCFSGTVDASMTKMAGMAGMAGMPGKAPG
jgi:hypothetical protein